MAAYEAGAYTVDNYNRRIGPLRATEADLKAKKAEVAGELDHQTAVLARPEEVLQFASQLSDFLEKSSPKAGSSSASGLNLGRVPSSIGSRCPRTPSDPRQPKWCWPTTTETNTPRNHLPHTSLQGRTITNNTCLTPREVKTPDRFMALSQYLGRIFPEPIQQELEEPASVS